MALGWVGPLAFAAANQLQAITSVVNLTVPSSAFDPATGKAEVTLPRGLVLQVNATSSWKLRLRSLGSTFTCNGLTSTKPVSNLQLRSTDGSLLVPSVSFVQIAKGGNSHGWDEQAFDVILQVTGADVGGLYSVKLEFELR